MAVVVGVAFSGAAAPDALLDPGAAVRWGLPLATTTVRLAAALTIGSLALATFVLNPGPAAAGRHDEDSAHARRATSKAASADSGAAWRRAATIAAVSASAWAVAAVVQLVLQYSQTAGRPLTAAGFGEELGYYVTQIDAGRAGLYACLLAASVAVAAVAIARPLGAIWTLVLALVALVPVALTGHAAGAVSHDAATSSLWLHLCAVTIWAGGLAALVAVSGSVGRGLPVVAERYSRIAGWCFALVAFSGVVNAVIRVGSLDGLRTDYGTLLGVKVALFATLGAAGAWHRRRVLPTLAASDRDDGGARSPAFWRLAGGEVLVMGAVMGVSVALSATPPPVPQEPVGRPSPAEELIGGPVPAEPTWAGWFTETSPNVLLAVACLAALGMYLAWVMRLRRRGDSWPWTRTLAWVLGVATVAWATNGGAAAYGHILFSAHMVQHMVLVMVAPILLALGAPVTLAVRALPSRKDGSRGPREWLLALVHSRWAGFFAHPIVAAANVAISMIVFYWTPLFELSLTSHVGHLLMVTHFVLAGYMFANVLIGVDPGPNRPAYPLRLLLLFATMAFHAFFGIALTMGTQLLAADWFGALGLPWGVDALADQRRGGGIAWGIGEIPTLLLAIIVAVSWSRDDERTARREDRRADRDDDAELRAYNEMLAGLARRGGGG